MLWRMVVKLKNLNEVAQRRKITVMDCASFLCFSLAPSLAARQSSFVSFLKLSAAPSPVELGLLAAYFLVFSAFLYLCTPN